MITHDGRARHQAAKAGAVGTFAPLVAALAQLDLTADSVELVEWLLAAADISDAAIAPFVYFLPGRYTRMCVHRDEHFELLVLCWSPAARSPIHDHGRSRCFFKVHRGSLNVENYALAEGGCEPGPARLALGPSRIMRPGEIDVRSAAHEIHRVGAHGGPAISLHVYAKPLDECLVFDLDHQSCRTAMNRYDIPVR
jgi:cysteine dioxygenase